MAHWLVKSEPSAWSFADQIAAGEKGTSWNGVRNHAAKLNLMAMKVGEEAFFYHSNEGKAIVGIVAVTKPYYPDPTDESGRFGMVDFKAVRALERPVTLDDDQGRQASRQDDPGRQFAPVGPAGDRGRMARRARAGEGLKRPRQKT